MIARWMLTSVVLSCCVSNAVAALDEDPIVAAVRQLGRESAKGPSEVLRLLAKQPRPAVEALVAELAVVRNPPKGPIPDHRRPDPRTDAFLHAIWCVRGLQYLTGGVRFQAPTRHRFSEREEERAYWLKLDGESTVPFYATWMSQSLSYLAPEDAQRAIIEKWRAWYREHGASHRYRPAETIHDWFF
jgi:hypothetical protein